MIPAARIKYIRSLQQKKFRRLHGVFVAEGEKIVGELLHAATDAGQPGTFSLECICALREWMDRYGKLLPEGLETHVVSPAELGRISGLSAPNLVLAVAKVPDDPWSPGELLTGKTLVLDGIQDPGNMGTIIRTADWFGVRRVFCSPESADVYSPKVIQASMGSFLRVRATYTDLPALMKEVPGGHPVYGAFLDGENVFGIAPENPAVLVIGNESRGISRELLPFIGRKVRIPGAQTGAGGGAGAQTGAGGGPGQRQGARPGTGPESLNASVAAGILMAWLNNGLE